MIRLRTILSMCFIALFCVHYTHRPLLPCQARTMMMQPVQRSGKARTQSLPASQVRSSFIVMSNDADSNDSGIMESSMNEDLLNSGRSKIGNNLRSMQNPLNHTSSSHDYKCARFCVCHPRSVRSAKSPTIKKNLTEANCEDPEFNDVLSLDRKTQIIRISLPLNTTSSKTGSDIFAIEEPPETAAHSSRNFRMPRLVQFDALREIVIINLRFEVCDSEVFKKGQKLRRIQWNYNQLNRISKACFRYLDKLVDLDLSYNRLGELESALFSNLVNLSALKIAYNQLSELAAHQFANLTKLTSLNLVGNQFKSINLHLFEPMQSSLRLLLLSKNQIKTFTHSTPSFTGNQNTNLLIPTNSSKLFSKGILGNSSNPYFVGTIFKSLIKLNVDQNKFERIKSLQLHRFYNVKFLSIRRNNIITIRDKAFNGLKLIEMNLAENKLQTVSKCAFCNATIKRLILARNNITIPLPSVLIDLPNIVPAQSMAATMTTSKTIISPAANQPTENIPNLDPNLILPTSPTTSTTSAHASQNVLILSQSIFGPLFANLEYLDISGNEYIAEDLELLLEPLLELRFLNLASTGLDEALPTPTLFKNLHLLEYLNLSHNQLDQLVSETVEPLVNLKVLDLSNNKFSEMDESFLVTLEEMSTLELVNFGSNPWYCSQCKIGPLYEWIFRSPIYNSTCLMPLVVASSTSTASSTLDIINGISGIEEDLPSLDTALKDQRQSSELLNPKSVDYSLLIDDDWQHMETGDLSKLLTNSIDFDIVLDGSYNEDDAANYHMTSDNGVNTSEPLSNNERQNPKNRPLNSVLSRTLITGEDDPSVAHTFSSLAVYEASTSRQLAREYCLKCEFPGELRDSFIHELSSSDFKYCSGSATRLAASEPKIGLTLAIVIIFALFCIIIVVIVIYRKKSNTYYPNEETDRLEQSSGAMSKGKHPVLSVSSDMDHQYGDGTDYSSPPVSQSYESYSNESPGADGVDEQEEEEDDDGYDEDEDEEIDEGEDYVDEDEEDDDDASGNHGAHSDAAGTHEDEPSTGGDRKDQSESPDTGHYQQTSGGPTTSDDKNNTTSINTTPAGDSQEGIRHIDDNQHDVERATNTSRGNDKTTNTSRSSDKRPIRGKMSHGSSTKSSGLTNETSIKNDTASSQTHDFARSSTEQGKQMNPKAQSHKQAVESSANEEQPVIAPVVSSRPRMSLTKSMTTAGRKQRPILLKSSLSGDSNQQQVRMVGKNEHPLQKKSNHVKRSQHPASSSHHHISETPLVENLAEVAATHLEKSSDMLVEDPYNNSHKLLNEKNVRSGTNSNSLTRTTSGSQPRTTFMINTMPNAGKLMKIANSKSNSQTSSQKGSLQGVEIPMPTVTSSTNPMQVKFARGSTPTSEYREEGEASQAKQLPPKRLPVQTRHPVEASNKESGDSLARVAIEADQRAQRIRQQQHLSNQPGKNARLIRLESQTIGSVVPDEDHQPSRAEAVDPNGSTYTGINRQAAIVSPQMATNGNKDSLKRSFKTGKESQSSSMGSKDLTGGTSSGFVRKTAPRLNQESGSNLARLRRLQPADEIPPEMDTSNFKDESNLQKNHNEPHIYENVGNNLNRSTRPRQQSESHQPVSVRNNNTITTRPRLAQAVMSPAVSTDASTLADSLAFEGLEDLPSDLDMDALVEVVDATDPDANKNYEMAFSPAATLVSDEADLMIDETDCRAPIQYQRGAGSRRQMTTQADSGRQRSNQNLNQLRPSNSTHSALTQSSSREFNVPTSESPG